MITLAGNPVAQLGATIAGLDGCTDCRAAELATPGTAAARAVIAGFILPTPPPLPGTGPVPRLAGGRGPGQLAASSGPVASPGVSCSGSGTPGSTCSM